MGLSERHNFLIFEDRKFADIGNTVKLQYTSGIFKISDWADIVNCHIISGEGIIQTLEKASVGRERALLLIYDMSSRPNNFHEKYKEECINLSHKYHHFCIGFIAPSKPAGLNSDLITITPGISLDSNKDLSDQTYMSPSSAISGGADVIIVGRAIVNSKDPAFESRRYRNEGWKAYLDDLK